MQGELGLGFHNNMKEHIKDNRFNAKNGLATVKRWEQKVSQTYLSEWGQCCFSSLKLNFSVILLYLEASELLLCMFSVLGCYIKVIEL